MEMKRTASLLYAFVAASLLTTPPAFGYFELELESGGSMVADSYVEEDDAYRLYRPGGELRIDKNRVVSIRERDGRLGEPTASRPRAPEVREAAAPAPLPDGDNLEALERTLGRELIFAHRDLVFARNRGESKEELKKRRKDIDTLEKRRSEAQKKLGIR